MKSKEKRLIILLGRYTFDENVVKEIKELLSNELRWEKILEYAINCKCVGLVYFNIRRLGLMIYIKPIIYNIFKYYYQCNKYRNKMVLEEKRHLVKIFENEKVVLYPLKGARLLDEVYTDLGSRALNDLDFLCDLEDRVLIDNIMQKRGYEQGDFDWSSYLIKRMERQKLISWKINLNTIPIYLKKPEIDDPIIDFFAVDFSYALDLKKDISVTKKILSNGSNNEMDKIDFLLHLCCHLYKEAEEAIWIKAAADLNLIKFCDIREFVLYHFDSYQNEQLSMIITRAEEYNCWEELYFSLYFVEEIYHDNIIAEILEEMKTRHMVLNETRYFQLDNSEVAKEAFYERMFAFENADILDNSYRKGGDDVGKE